jgi:hypothetical protein
VLPEHSREVAVTRESARERDIGQVRGWIRFQSPDRRAQLHFEPVSRERHPVRTAERPREMRDRTAKPARYLTRQQAPVYVRGDHRPGAMRQVAGRHGMRAHGGNVPSGEVRPCRKVTGDVDA